MGVCHAVIFSVQILEPRGFGSDPSSTTLATGSNLGQVAFSPVSKFYFWNGDSCSYTTLLGVLN